MERNRKGDINSDSLATSVMTRLQAKRATEQAILRRNTQLAAFHQASYAEVLTNTKGKWPVQAKGKQRIYDEPLQKAFKKKEGPLRGQGSRINDEQRLRSNTTCIGENKQANEGGWTEDRRKKRNTQPRHQCTTLKQPWKKDLLTQGRCFNCLERGHRRFQCNKETTCLKCNKKGHISYKCKASLKDINEVGKGVKAQPNKANQHDIKRAEHNLVETQTQLQQTTKNSEMDVLTNWEIMNLINLVYIESGLLEDAKVFLPSRVEILPTNEFLDRSAIVMTGPDHNDRHFAHRTSSALATHFRRNPREFKVSKIPQTMGDYIAIFPNKDLKNQAVDICVFRLGPGVEVQLSRWTERSGMVYNPSTHKARIKIHGLPLQYWNMEDLTELVSGFGRLEQIAPFFHNGNYEELKVLVGCYHPINIPRNLMATRTLTQS